MQSKRLFRLKNYKYAIEVGSQLTIKFPSEFSHFTLELALSKAYRKSKQKKNKQILFDLSDCVEFHDITLLNSLGIWIKKLQEIDKEISLSLPNNKSLKGKLYEIGFFDLIGSVEYKSEQIEFKFSRGSQSPMKFFSDELAFRNYIRQLNDDQLFANILSGGNGFDIQNKGRIRDIIIFELGDNIFNHAESNYSNIILSVIDKNEVKKSTNSASYLDKLFLSSVDSDVLSISLSDDGVGIVKSLKDAFPKKFRSNIEYLVFAFEMYSSRRTGNQRLLDDDTAEDPDFEEIYKPTTGLYRILNYVRYSKGFLQVKSGGSIITFDFFSEPDGVIRKNTDDTFKENYLSSIVDFPGTHFKILIPQLEKAEKQKVKLDFEFPEYQKRIQRRYISVLDFTDIFSSNKPLQKEAMNLIVTLFEEIFDHRQHSKKTGIIFDLGGLRTILDKNKVLQYVVAHLITKQGRNFTNVLVNVSSEIEPILKDSFNNRDGYDYTPLVYFNQSFERKFLCVNSEESDRLSELFKRSFLNLDDDNNKYLVERFKNLFISSGRSGISFIHNRQFLFESLVEQYKKRLHDFIENPDNLIYHKDVRVRLYSNYYCKGYYEIDRLVENDKINQIASLLIEYQLVINRPSFVFSLSKHVVKIVDEILSRNTGTPLDRIRNVKIRDPLTLDYSNLFDVTRSISKTDPVIIFTDVVGSTTSILHLLRILGKLNIQFIHSFINVSGLKKIELSGFQVGMTSIVEKKWNFLESKPPEWRNHEIWFVNPETNRLQSNPLKDNQALWNPFRESAQQKDIFNELIVKNGYLAARRTIINDDVYSKYPIDLKRLLKDFGIQFAKVILNNLSDYVKSDKDLKINNALLLHITEKEQLSSLLHQIVHQSDLNFSPNTILKSFFHKGHTAPLKSFDGKTIVLVEDVFFSSQVVFDFVDYCSRYGAEQVFIYFVLKQGDLDDYNHLKKTKLYDNVRLHVEFLIDIPLPIYEMSSPDDIIVSDLQFIRRNLQNSQFETASLAGTVDRFLASLDYTTNFDFTDSCEDVELITIAANFQKGIKDEREIQIIINELMGSELNDHKLVILEVYGTELIYVFEDVYSDKPLYEDLQSSLIQACLSILSNLDERVISEEQFFGILNILRFYSPLLFLNTSTELIQQIVNNKSYLDIFIIQFLLLLFEDGDGYELPDGRLKKFNEKIIQFHEKNSQLKYLSSQIDHGTNAQNPGCHYLIRVSQEMHAIRRSQDLLISSMSPNPDYDVIEETTKSLKQSLIYISESIETLSGKKYWSDASNQYLKSCKLELSKIINWIDDFDVKRYSITEENLHFAIDHLRLFMNSRHHGVSLTTLFNILEQDINQIILRVQRVYLSRFEEKNITMGELKMSGEQILVFGEKDVLFKVFMNIFDNIFKHSNSNFVAIEIRNDSKDFVTIEFADNGLEFNKWLKIAKRPIDKGLGIIDDVLSIYDGEISYSQNTISEQNLNITTIKLRVLPKDQNESYYLN